MKCNVVMNQLIQEAEIICNLNLRIKIIYIQDENSKFSKGGEEFISFFSSDFFWTEQLK
jgi:hypothetical protein